MLRNHRRFRPVVLARQLSNLDEFPIEPIVHLAPAGVPLARRVTRRARSVAARMPSTYDHELARAASGHGCVAFHAHFGPSGANAVVATSRTRLPLVTTFYGYDLVAPRRDPARYAEPYARLFEAGSLFICEGSAMARTLEELGAPADRVRIVRIGIDLRRFPFEPRSAGRPLVLVQAARFVPKKGIDTSIRAFAAALPEIAPAELVLVGDGPLRGELEQLVTELGVTGSVRFAGMCSHADYARLLREAHIGLQPSRTAPDGETEGGAPTALLEMQACGIPVVATRHADIPEVVAEPELLPAEEDFEGVASEIVRWATAASDEWLARLSRARRHVEGRHDAHLAARRVEDLYEEALDAPAGSPAT